MPTYLFAVQDSNGREVVSWKGEVDKVSEVTVDRDGTEVFLVHGENPVEHGIYEGDGPLTLHRWNADDKLAAPVSHPVK